MTAKRRLLVTGLALCCLAALAVSLYHPAAPEARQRPPDYSGYKHDYSDATLRDVIPGQTTKKQVVRLLGDPWRTINYAEPGEDAPGEEPPEIWEWRGKDSEMGPYRVHIEFNGAGTATLIAKIPENTGKAWARAMPASAQVSAPAARPGVTDNPSAGMFRYQAPPPPTKNGGD